RRRRNRAKLTIAVHHDCVAYYSGPANASNVGGGVDGLRITYAVRICGHSPDADGVGLLDAQVANVDIVVAGGEITTGALARCDVITASCIVTKCVIAVSRISGEGYKVSPRKA